MVLETDKALELPQTLRFQLAERDAVMLVAHSVRASDPRGCLLQGTSEGCRMWLMSRCKASLAYMVTSYTIYMICTSAHAYTYADIVAKNSEVIGRDVCCTSQQETEL